MNSKSSFINKLFNVKILLGVFLMLSVFPEYSQANLVRLDSIESLTMMLGHTNIFKEYLNKHLYTLQYSIKVDRILFPAVVNKKKYNIFAKKYDPLYLSDIILSTKKVSRRGQTKIIKVKVYYKVKKGDNLWTIARRYGTTEKHLMKINNLKTDLIMPGQNLFIGVRDKVVEIPYINEQEVKEEVLNFKEKLTNGEFDGQDLYQVIGYKIVDISLNYLGFPYKYGGESLWGMDCSAFVRRVIRFFGLELPRTSLEQGSLGKKITLDQLIPGDLLFFRRRNQKIVSHVGIYLGDNKFIHASGPDKQIVISDIGKSFYKYQFKIARRIVNLLLPLQNPYMEPVQ